MSSVWLAVLILCVALVAGQSNFCGKYVATNGTATSCGTFATPCNTIEAGLSAIGTNVGTLCLMAGVYTGTGNVGIFWNNMFNRVMAYDSDVTIDCGGSTRFFAATNASPKLDNMVIQNCRSDFGGAVYLDTSSATLRNVTFVGNTATNSGGAIYLTSSSVILQNCTFLNNAAVAAVSTIANGGAIGSDTRNDNQVQCQDSLFHNNRVSNSAGSAQGGAISCYESVVSTRCTFSANYAQSPQEVRGGAIASGGYNTRATQSTFRDNFAFSTGAAAKALGGAVYLRLTGPHPDVSLGLSLTVTNCTFVGNNATASPASSSSTGAFGGAIAYTSSCTASSYPLALNITDSVFDANAVVCRGNCLARGGALDLSQTVWNNGSAINQTRLAVTISSVAFRNNSAASNGAATSGAVYSALFVAGSDSVGQVKFCSATTVFNSAVFSGNAAVASFASYDAVNLFAMVGGGLVETGAVNSYGSFVFTNTQFYLRNGTVLGSEQPLLGTGQLGRTLSIFSGLDSCASVSFNGVNTTVFSPAGPSTGSAAQVVPSVLFALLCAVCAVMVL